MNVVIRNYGVTTLMVLVDIGIAWLVARVLSSRIRTEWLNRIRSASFLIGSILLLVAGIGRLGWSIQTLGGNSAGECLDQILFFALSLVGAFMITLEYSLGRRFR